MEVKETVVETTELVNALIPLTTYQVKLSIKQKICQIIISIQN